MKCINKINKELALFSLVIIFISCIKCDIPVHCLKSNIIGEWKIYATKAYKQTLNSLYKIACSHTIPSNESNAYKTYIDKENFIKSYQITLKDNDKTLLNIYNEELHLLKKAEGTIKLGKWTMVYDEGFDIMVEDYSFFAFSKYVPSNKKYLSSNKKSNWSSMCYSTLIGWYHKGEYWGCFYAEKQGVNPRQITNEEVDNKLVVVENTVKPKVDSKLSPFYMMKFREIGHGELNSNFNDLEKHNIRDYNKLSFNALNHNEIVSKINSMQNLWEATNYMEFANMSLKELNKYAGRKKNFSHTHGNQFKNKNNKVLHPRFLEKSYFARKRIENKNNNFHNDFPKNFLKWVPYMSEARNQGHCGSCYAVATINMLEARLRIKYNINERLSLDHILKCSVYNQGCDGGYSYLVLKFGQELELIPESCENYYNGEFSCFKKCPSNKDQKRVYKVNNFSYLGGSYGKCNEELIMKELMTNGPIVVSFEPDYNFMLYKKGIYKSLNESNWIKNGLPKPEWEKVDHSVTLVGWGYDDNVKEKYWLLLNSWGKHWGENGYFKMVRGIDHMGIESICEAGNLNYVDL